ncbi:MAG: hypothetical protein A4E28_02767 [Methanocella sp. PtaU1.Bin125]|nr:MAG: hypothetical protein A4E28_02767 [Methanocella sp. PtaU1.Bin125]
MSDGPDRDEKETISDRAMDWFSVLFFYVITLLFILISLVLIGLAFDRLYATATAFPQIALDSLFETIGFTTIAAAVFELARTMYEEEIRSEVKMTAPIKIRHFISRFLTVIVISLSIEFLTMVFRYSHKPTEFAYLFEAAAVAVGIALLFIAWAFYNRTSVPVEQFERNTGGKRNG